MKDLSEYQYIVGYGIGQYYNYVKAQFPKGFRLDFLCDANWERLGAEYDGIKVISPEKLSALSGVFVIVFSGNRRNYNSITSMLNKMKYPFAHAKTVLETTVTVTEKQLKNMSDGLYDDVRGNRIKYMDDVEDSIIVRFTGSNNQIIIEKGVSVGGLEISCGQNTKIYIGAGTEIEGLKIYGTDGGIWIGENCLISFQVVLRNHNTHHIFDKKTGKRINYPGKMRIGNHVWIGYGVTLLGSASIGDNSIVGTMAVTSSAFPKEVVIAGNPARIIREQVCWSKDNTNYYNHDFLSECLAKEAMKYF